MEKGNILKNDFSKFFCEKCNRELNTDWQYCPYCLTKIEKEECTNCGNRVMKNWSFCPYCKIERLKKEMKTNEVNSQDSNEWLRNILLKD